MAGVVHIPWYATGFRADQLEQALAGIASIAPRYGATSYQVFRFRDDRYKFLQTVEFASKEQWESYWYSPEFIEFRTLASSWYQVPVLYGWTDLVASGTLHDDDLAGHEARGTGTGDLPG
jgi:hypothetical protein